MHTQQDISPSVPTRVAMLAIRWYQACVSPLFPSACRFEPTCSHYGLQALQEHGFVKGIALTARRVMRCHPGGPHGYDPVPKRSTTHPGA